MTNQQIACPGSSPGGSPRAMTTAKRKISNRSVAARNFAQWQCSAMPRTATMARRRNCMHRERRDVFVRWEAAPSRARQKREKFLWHHREFEQSRRPRRSTSRAKAYVKQIVLFHAHAGTEQPNMTGRGKGDRNKKEETKHYTMIAAELPDEAASEP